MDHTQSRRLLLNFALLLLVVGLGAFVWWQSNAQHKAPETLLGLGKADVTRVTIAHHPGTAKPEFMLLEKQAGKWKMLVPEKFDVDSNKLAQLLTLLDETVEASYDATGKDLKQYGLAPANVALSFNNETLLLGAENPVSHTRYFLHGGKIKLASEAVYGLLTGGVEEWRQAPQ
ncbi:MAG: DUF4340 domain-containing protein [Thiothrix sp.]|uniref:DUF4340 domain-containing protein n=1 Tax=Thiothrix sp. TaxID=1032 RepID=UPI00261BD148|nr:DUF4340 domain-containing protein [Thiothrix sp.]MDD5391497.1 DUF4340 domain-containing protein [Thiothrix sp.]